MGHEPFYGINLGQYFPYDQGEEAHNDNVSFRPDNFNYKKGQYNFEIKYNSTAHFISIQCSSGRYNIAINYNCVLFAKMFIISTKEVLCSPISVGCLVVLIA